MKKQLLIAAVAATMTSVAIADISITGATKVNYTTVDFDSATKDSTNKFSHEVDLAITGKNGDTTVVLKLGNLEDTDTNAVDIEDSYLATKVGDVSIKAGSWDNGDNALRASSRAENKFSASTTMSGLTLTGNSNSDANGSMTQSVKVAGSVAGVTASYEDTTSGETVGLSTSVAGIKVSYLALNSDTADSDRSVIELSGTAGGMNIKVAQATADADAQITGNGWMGDFEDATYTGVEANAYDLADGQDVTSFELSTAMAGNTITFRNTEVDGVAGLDMSFNKIILNRPLANGTTFEATYTDLDDSDATNDSTTLDLELAVKF